MTISVGQTKSRIVFLTIGQTPRVDIIEDMLGGIDFPLEVTELGVLDGLDPKDIVPPASEDEHRLVSRMSDGTEVICSEPWIVQRLKAMLEKIDPEKFDAVLILCSGQMQGLRCRLPVVSAAEAVDGPIAKWLADGRDMAIIVPNRDQIGELSSRYSGGGKVVFAVASPYRDTDFVKIGESVKGAEHIVMHCMGYDAAMCDQLSSGAEVEAKTARQMFVGYLTDHLNSVVNRIPN